jgi:hypothetical protein
MQTVTAFVSRDPATCWQIFTDVNLLTAWVPNLRRVETIAKTLSGLPGEVHFEYASSMTYTLVYAYDAATREVRWQPKLGKRDGVTGFARFDAFDSGTRITYGIEHGDNRAASDRNDQQQLVDAFVAFATKR